MTRSPSTVHRIAVEERRHPPGRSRVPEPMVMDGESSIEQFHASGARLAGMQAVYELSAHSLDALVPGGGRLLDLGVGSGRALARFLDLRPDVSATGVDLSAGMLAQARRFLDAAGLGKRVTLVEGDLTALPGPVVDRSWDAISSVWALHHMRDRRMLRAALRQIAALRERGGSALWLLDLQRLRNPGSFAAFMAALQPDAPAVLRSDARASEAAAFTLEELRAECMAAGLDGIESGIAQPIAWLQAHWCDAGRAGVCTDERPAGGTLPADAPLLHGGFSRLPIR